jgi:ribose transport system permease protein
MNQPGAVSSTSSAGRTVIPSWLNDDSLTTVSLIISFVLLCLAFASQTNTFLTLNNFENIFKQLAVVGIASIGMTLVLVAGGVDLSVGSVAALSGVVISILWLKSGVPIGIATVLGLGSGALVGFLNGFAVTFLKINALITTLASLSIVRGLSFVLSEGQTNQLNNDHFKFIGRGEIAGIAFSLLLMLTLYIVFYIIMRHTPFGRNLYAIGGSPDASRLAGIPVTRHLLIAFTLSGFLAALSGIILAAQLGSSAPRAATGLEFTVVTAVILGGTSLAGGKGNLIGTFVGIVILRTLSNGLTVTEVSSSYQDVAFGAALIIAVGLDQIRLKISARQKVAS